MIIHLLDASAHRGGFRLCYIPRYTKKINLNLFLTIRNTTLHKVKYLELGDGIFYTSLSLITYLMFPYMTARASGKTYLT